MKTYVLKLINSEEIKVQADGYNVFHEGKVISFYVKLQTGGRTKTVLDVVMQNILFMSKIDEN